VDARFRRGELHFAGAVAFCGSRFPIPDSRELLDEKLKCIGPAVEYENIGQPAQTRRVSRGRGGRTQLDLPEDR